MSYLKLIFLSVSIVSLSLSFATVANTNNEPKHVHGEALVNIAIQDNDIMMEIDSPAINFLGFEQQPVSDEQMNLLIKTVAELNQPEKVIQFVGASCNLTEKSVDEPYKLKGDSDKISSASHSHSHSDKEPIDEHGDINISYKFHCDSIEKLSEILFPVLTNYPHLMKLNAQWVFPRGQGSKMLTVDDSVIEMKDLY